MAVTRSSILLEGERAERARRGARRCVPPMALLVVVFVLPSIRACDRTMSPLQLGLASSLDAFMAWPVFAIAAGLVWLTLLQPREHPLSEPVRGVLAAPVLTWLSCLLPGYLMVHEWREWHPSAAAQIVAAGGLLVALPLSIVAFMRALRAQGWRRWRHALTSFAAATWLTYPAQTVFAYAFTDVERPALRWGAYVFAAALVWLSVAAARRG